MQYFKNSENKLTWKFTVTLITFATLIIPGVAEAKLVVIANPDSHVKMLTKNQLAALYLGQPISINARVAPYNQPSNTQAFTEFYQQVLGWDTNQVSAYWTKQVFSGFSQGFPSVSSDQAAIALVKQNLTAIAYVDSRSLKKVGNTVKVIYGDYKIPVQKPAARKQSLQPNILYSSSSNNGYMTALSSDPDSDTSSNTIGSVTDPDTELAQQLTTINAINQYQPSENIWALIASHMILQHNINHPNVRHWILWFQQHPKVLATMFDNSAPYLYYVYQQTQRRHMPAEFALLPMIESGYNPRAYSSKGAVGLWQLMPGTASSFGMEIDWWYDSRRDILTATHAGLNFLVYLHNMTHSWLLAAAAYNIGPGALEAAIRHNESNNKKTDFWDLRLPRETENYVPKLLAISAIIANPSQYGIRLPYVPAHPFFASVILTSQMDLQAISQFSGVSIPVIRALNPGLQRWATAPRGRFTLLLPLMSVAKFSTNLQKVIGQQHVGWKYYRVRSADSLPSIAAKNATTIAKLQQVNRLRFATVKRGEGILVPVVNGEIYTKLAGITGTVKSMQSKQEAILSRALSRAARSQRKALPAEVTGEPIKASDDLKSLVDKLYGDE